ncbi:riboflavin synthase [Candidatus Entotheonella palauensis]|nr:riboflavin synthase [Candidatus Entotheonella palauensis]
MFSGIVEEVGTIAALDKRPGGITLTIRARHVLGQTQIGDSIAVNGACLTVVRFDEQTFDVDMAPETLRKTSLNQCGVGADVNLERSLMANGRVGGHFVQGHIDSTAEVVEMAPDGEGVLATFRAPVELMRYIVPKGYVAIDGMSLTVVDTGPDWFSISFIPHTREVTVVKYYDSGHLVNLEVDILGKYVEKLLAHRPVTS